jgi:hypothetical protein
MQCAGYMIIHRRKWLVLLRVHKTYVALRLRDSGRDGIHLTDEQKYFEADTPETRWNLKKLRAGLVIKC